MYTETYALVTLFGFLFRRSASLETALRRPLPTVVAESMT